MPRCIRPRRTPSKSNGKKPRTWKYVEPSDLVRGDVIIVGRARAWVDEVLPTKIWACFDRPTGQRFQIDLPHRTRFRRVNNKEVGLYPPPPTHLSRLIEKEKEQFQERMKNMPRSSRV